MRAAWFPERVATFSSTPQLYASPSFSLTVSWGGFTGCFSLVCEIFHVLHRAGERLVADSVGPRCLGWVSDQTSHDGQRKGFSSEQLLLHLGDWGAFS